MRSLIRPRFILHSPMMHPLKRKVMRCWNDWPFRYYPAHRAVDCSPKSVQKRSLCYSVWASYRPSRETGQVEIYAGTTPERAQQTLDVIIDECARLQNGITDEEFNRAKIGLKSRLVMRGESTAARSAAIASDVFKLGTPRDLNAWTSAIDGISLEELNQYLKSRNGQPQTIVVLGPEPLESSKPSSPLDLDSIP